MDNGPFAPGPVEDHGYGNPVPAHIVYMCMSSNFPPESIDWVKRATWEGPVDISWDNIDTDSVESWAASHQPEKVKEFEDKIKAHDGDVMPSILIKDNDTPKSIIIDGHHRAVARNNLKMPVLSYVGRINPKDRGAALETHSNQINQGDSPGNKIDMNSILFKLEGFWFARQVGHPASKGDIFKVLVQLRDAGRDVSILEREANDFGWTVKQLDDPALRMWLCGSK